MQTTKQTFFSCYDRPETWKDSLARLTNWNKISLELFQVNHSSAFVGKVWIDSEEVIVEKRPLTWPLDHQLIWRSNEYWNEICHVWYVFFSDKKNHENYFLCQIFGSKSEKGRMEILQFAASHFLWQDGFEKLMRLAKGPTMVGLLLIIGWII